MKAYLWINAVLYPAFALFCTVRPGPASRASGHLQLDASGRCEYLVVYGGLELGLAVAYAWLAWHPALHRLGVDFSVVLYGAIVLYRAGSAVALWPVSGTTLAVGGLEAALLAGALALRLSS